MTTGVLTRMLRGLPPYETNDPFVQSIYGAFSNELERATATATAIRDGLIPSQATDEYKGLSMLEAQLLLPVAPPGLSDDQRRALVMAWIQARRAGTGAAWVELVTLTFGGAPWAYQVGPDDYTVTIFVPLSAGSITAFQALVLARAITPAHIDIIPTYGTGFLIGISEIGVEPL